MTNKLMKCKDCGKDISKTADKCPSCGAPNYQGCLIALGWIVGTIIIIIVLVVTYASFSTGEQPTKQDLAKCKQNISCWSKKSYSAAVIACKPELEELPKWNYKWGAFNAGKLANSLASAEIFSESQWNNQKKLIIKYRGNTIMVQNGFGSWRQAQYYCVYDTVNNKVIEVLMW